MAIGTQSMLNQMSENPIILQRFMNEPKSVMDEFSVPEAHQELILDGEKEKLADETGLDDKKTQLLIF